MNSLPGLRGAGPLIQYYTGPHWNEKGLFNFINHWLITSAYLLFSRKFMAAVCIYVCNPVNGASQEQRLQSQPPLKVVG